MARRSTRLALKAEAKDAVVDLEHFVCSQTKGVNETDDTSAVLDTVPLEAGDSPYAPKVGKKRVAPMKRQKTQITQPEILENVMRFILQPASLGNFSMSCKAAQAAFISMKQVTPYFAFALAGGERLCGRPIPSQRSFDIVAGKRCEICGKGNVKGLKLEFCVWAHDACIKPMLIPSYSISPSDRELLLASRAPHLITECWNPHKRPHAYTLAEFWSGGATASIQTAVPASEASVQAGPAAPLALPSFIPSSSLMDPSETLLGVRLLGSISAARAAGEERVAARASATSAAAAAEQLASLVRKDIAARLNAKRALRKSLRSPVDEEEEVENEGGC